MQIRLLNKKWRVSELTNPEKMRLRKLAVNYKVQEGVFWLENNVFNRIILGVKEPTHHEPTVQINPKARDYQVRDILGMLQRDHVLNRNKPGYGKTFEAIEYCRLSGFKRIMIVCPKSVLQQWKEQFELWWPEVAPTVVVGGAGPSRGASSIFVTNYEQLTPRNVAAKGARRKVLMPSKVWMRCKEWVWDVLILDESHRIKNPQSQITIAIKDIPATHRVALSGTPILSRPDDLWSQLHFLDPNISGSSYWAFAERFCDIEEGFVGKRIIGLTPSAGAQEVLTAALSAVSVGGENHKVTKGITRIVVQLDLPAEVRNLYRAVVSLAFETLDKYGVTVKNAMDQIIKQQQVSTNVGMLADMPNVKFEWVKDWLEDNEGEKVVIFSKFAETAKRLHEYLLQHKVRAQLYIGQMNSKERASAKENFVQRDTRALIGTIGALGLGVDGLQFACKNVIFLDRDWTPGLNEQAEQRVDRSGQEGMTVVWILHAKRTIDQHVEGIANKKAEDILEVFKNVRDGIRSGE